MVCLRNTEKAGSEPGSGDGVGVQPQDEDGDHQKLSQPVMKSRFSCWM